MSNSLISGTTWYWRQGIRQTPMHSHRDFGDVCRTRELYLPVKNETQAQDIINELQQKGIEMAMKKTHSSFDVVPAGSLIVFAAMSQVTELSSEKENMEKLKSYILENGGKIGENSPKVSIIKSFMQLFGRK